jgi:hypothetical protein
MGDNLIVILITGKHFGNHVCVPLISFLLLKIEL